ncbi:centromere-associated protein E isoform X2 [Scyliorhinus canicula]|uniref:centromere-associated protein E isoform X2 n=1 Tax=Scyliorhinus canicula TaxID=7830 RepID=UPI0018F4C361|nr:centromere-associated protein E isoform X2 [Scyliorhinus canicula]
MSEEGAVQVCVRVRPLNDREKSLQGGSADDPPIHWKADSQTISQISGTRSFNFDRVFHAKETTATLYNEVAHSIVRSITQGYNGTIFAYGQTSSGKTYTMMGNAVAPGLIPLAIRNLFSVINDTLNREFLLRASYVEIYNESVSDLLADSKRRPLEVREDVNRTVYVAGLTEELAVTYEDVMKLVRKGEKNRHYGETKLNQRSSRSHTIFRVIVESRDKTNEAVMVAHLNLIDLAGSERASQTGTEGVRLKEGCFINRSLFVLGQVIKKLSDGQAGVFLNYRDSKLTRILQNSLGGNARTLIICTITPVGFEETLSTLQFASTAKFMKNTPHVNEVLDDEAMLKRCSKEITVLKNQLEELTSDNRVHAEEKAQLLSEKYMLQMEFEEKIKNLTKMLVRVSPDEEMKARRKRRVTWAAEKLHANLDTPAKIIKLDKIFQEQDEDDYDFDVDSDWPSKTISECSSTITTKRGGSGGCQVPPFDDSMFFNDQSRGSLNSSSLVYDVPSKDELEQRVSELEKQLETLTEEKEKESRNHKDYTSHIVKQLQDSIEICELLYSKRFDAESSKLENDKQKEEIEELKDLLKEQVEDAKHFKTENEIQRKEIQELEKLRERIEELKERREIEEFEFLEKEAEKEEKAQQKHENARLRELIHNSEIINQELEAELKTKTQRLKEQEQNLLHLQQQLEQLKDVSDGKVNLEMLTVQIKQLQQSMNDAEVVTRDAKKESSIFRSENLELKEEMEKMRVSYQRMEKDVQLYSNQLDTERSRYKEMQCDLQKELNSTFNENTKLMSLMDGKVPHDLLERVHLEKDIFDLKQRLEKAQQEKSSLQEEASLLSQYKSLPEKVDELTKQVLKLTEELIGVASERDNLLAYKEENVENLENLYGEMSAIAQDRNKLQEMLASLQSERERQENLITEQQNEMQCRVANLKKELDLYSTKLEEEKTKCAQFQYDIEDKEKQVKEQEQQLKQELQKQKEIEDRYSEASENLKLLNEEKEELLIKLQVVTKAKEELAMSQSMSHQQKNRESLSSEKEALHQELMDLRTEREQLKSDLQENIDMCIENQAELRSLQDKLRLNQNVEVKLKGSLSELEHLLNEEKEKMHEQTEELNRVVSQRDLLLTEIEELGVQISEEHKSEIQQLENEKSLLVKEKDDLQVRLENVKTERDEMKNILQESTKKMQEQSEELHYVKSQRDVSIGEIDEMKTRVSKELSTEFREEKFNQQLQQQEDEKLTIEKENLQEQLENVKSRNDELINTLQQNTEAEEEQSKEMQLVMSQRDVLLSEIEELRARVSDEQKAEIQVKEFNQRLQQLEEEFNQRLQQLEEEKSTIIKENENLQAMLESAQVQRDEMKSTLQENTVVMLEQSEKLHHMVSQRDVLLGEVNVLKTHVSKELSIELLEEKFNQRLQNEKLTIVKENLKEQLENVKSQQHGLTNTLQENTEAKEEQTKEMQLVMSQRDVLLSEIEELRARVSNEQKAEIQVKEFNQRLQQLEDEKSTIIKENENLQAMLARAQEQRDEMTSTLQENTVVMQESNAKLHHVVSQRDVLPIEVDDLKTCVSKELNTELLEEKFNQLQQLEDEKLTIVKEKENLKEQLENVKSQNNELMNTRQENTEAEEERIKEMQLVMSERDVLFSEIEELRARVSNEQKAEIQMKEFNQRLQQLEDEKSTIIKENENLQTMLESAQVQRDGMKSTLEEHTLVMQEQSEKLQHVVSQRDVLLGEVDELKTRVTEELNTELPEEKFNQRLQQLEDEKLAIVKEKENLIEQLENVKSQNNELMNVRQENTEAKEEQVKEMHLVRSQRDVLLSEIEELRARVSNEQKAEIQVKEFNQRLQQLEEEFNQRLQQLEEEKSTIIKENENLQAMLESAQVQRAEMKSTLQENTAMMQERSEKLYHVVSQRDVLLGEVDDLKSRASKKLNTELLKEEFHQRVQQLEDEKLTIVKEKENLKKQLENVKSQNNEMMNTRQENTEAMQEQAKEIHLVMTQRDVLLNEIEVLRVRVSNEQKAEIQANKCNQRLQELEDDKSTILKENENLQAILESAQDQRDKMKSTLQENTKMWTDEFNSVRNHRDQLLSEIEQLREELKTHVSKMQEMELLQRVSSDQLEKEKISLLMEKDQLKLQMEKTQKVLCEKADMLKMEERKNKELKESVTALEEQIITLNEERAQIVSTNSETDPIEAEINKLCNQLQEKDLLLQNAIQSLFQLKDEYLINLSKTDQELLIEAEAWKELLIRFCSEVPEGSAESTGIGKLQKENQQLYENLVLWRSDYKRTLNAVPRREAQFQERNRACDEKLAEEKKRSEELRLQLQILKKQVSDPAELELISEAKKAEIRRISTLIANKEHHLQNVQQNLLKLKSKYPNFLTSSQNGLLSRAKARRCLMERISNLSGTNILKIIEEIKNENQTLDRQCQLQRKAVQSEGDLCNSILTEYSTYLRNSCDEMINEKRKNEELLLEIKALQQDSFNKNSYDPLLTMENQKLSKKLKAAEQLLQQRRIKIHDLQMTLTASQEAYKQQEDKLRDKKQDLQTELLKKDSQIKTVEESLKQLQAKLDMGAQPFKEELIELKNQLLALQMQKFKESKHFENEISSLKGSLEHKEKLLRQMKETLRRSQQEQNTTITIESKDERRSTDTCLTYSAGSGIVQNAIVPILKSEKSKLTQDLNKLKKENAYLARMVSELKYEINKWKERAEEHQEKDRTPLKHRMKHENVQNTFTLCPDESLTSLSQKECALMPQKVEISTELFPSASKATDTRDETALASEAMLPIDSSKMSLFGLESQTWPLPQSKIFDNSQLGFLAAESPQKKPKSDENEHNGWWSKHAADSECKMQ